MELALFSKLVSNNVKSNPDNLLQNSWKTLVKFVANFQLGKVFFVNVLTCVFFALSFFSWKNYQPQKHDAPYEKYAYLTEQSFAILKNQNAELVIAHNALAEYFTFTTGLDAMPWLPEYTIETDKLWRIATTVRMPILRKYLSEQELESVQRIGVSYYLMQEKVWQKFQANLLEHNESGVLDEINDWRNRLVQNSV